MPSNLKKFTQELRNKTALLRRLGQSKDDAQSANDSGDFPLKLRELIYSFLSAAFLINTISKLSKYDRFLLLSSGSSLLREMKNKCVTIFLDNKTTVKALKKQNFIHSICSYLKVIIRFISKPLL